MTFIGTPRIMWYIIFTTQCAFGWRANFKRHIIFQTRSEVSGSKGNNDPFVT